MALKIPDFENMVLDRLKLCHLDIQATNNVTPNIKRVFRLTPVLNLEASNTPMVAARAPGAMRQPIPRTSAGRIEIVRDYVVEVITNPTENTTDSDDEGALSLKYATNYIAVFRDYYLYHPRLSTNTLPELQYLIADIAFIDSGVIEMSAPGGSKYNGFLFTITTDMLYTADDLPIS